MRGEQSRFPVELGGRQGRRQATAPQLHSSERTYILNNARIYIQFLVKCCPASSSVGCDPNEGLQKKCRALYDYCRYVNRVKGNLKAGLPNQKAVEDALDYAIRGNFLDGFFKAQKMEVLNMSLTEFDQELYDRNRRREGREEG